MLAWLLYQQRLLLSNSDGTADVLCYTTSLSNVIRLARFNVKTDIYLWQLTFNFKVTLLS